MGNVHMEAAQINYRGGEKKMSVEEALKTTSGEAAAIAQLQQDVSDLNDVKANKITIAPTFSAETAYDPGDLVYYNGLTYRCVNAHEGEWDADDFAATTIANELAEVKSGLTSVNNRMVSMLTSYDASSQTFPVPDTAKPYDGQVVCAGRNLNNGAIYLLWYDSSVHGFHVGATVSGNAPSEGESVTIQYFA